MYNELERIVERENLKKMLYYFYMDGNSTGVKKIIEMQKENNINLYC